MLKKIILGFILAVFSFGSFSFAGNVLNMGEFLTVYFEGISKDIPASWKNIDVKYNNVKKGTPIYQSLQKGIFLDIFPNLNKELALDKVIKQEHIVRLLQLKIKRNFKFEKGKDITVDWTRYMIEYSTQKDIGNDKLDIEKLIFEDVKSRINEEFIFESNIDQKKGGDGAVKGYIDCLGDPYTVFMTPSEAKAFENELEGSFEGIGAQIEIQGEGIFVIIAPLKNSPAEKYGLMAKDVIINVNNKEVKKNTDLNELISWIKGPIDTFVTITVKRGNEIKEIKIKRGKIVLANIEYENLNGGNCYINIAQFNNQSQLQFDNAINFFENKNCQKYIMDVRNNPGGELSVVSNMLNHFVKGGETIATIKYKNIQEDIVANNNIKKMNNKNVVVLVNKGTASASEIFAGVIKDYVKNSIIIGTQTFGKGSVQSIIEYADGSMLKYTVAKRFTGGSQKNINLKGISPDLKLEDDPKTVIDEVLEVAKVYKFK